MMHAANTAKSTGSMGSTGSELVKPLEITALLEWWRRNPWPTG